MQISHLPSNLLVPSRPVNVPEASDPATTVSGHAPPSRQAVARVVPAVDGELMRTRLLGHQDSIDGGNAGHRYGRLAVAAYEAVELVERQEYLNTTLGIDLYA